MIPKTPEVDIPIDNPFQNDKLSRMEIATNLTTLLDSIKHPFVLAIDSPWGTGKTTFIRMWQQYLENQQFPTLYYNAWENDYNDDAFLSIFAEFEIGVKALKNKFNLENKLVESLDKAKKVGFQLTKNLLPAIIKIVSQGTIDIKGISAEALSDALQDITKQVFEKYEASKNNRERFKNLLTEFIEQLSSTDIFHRKPLVIFIDELDRCRPNFAIEILEKTKHFFNINGIIFIISVDKNQLQKSMQTIYGNEMAVDGYIRRFIDLEFRMPDPNYDNYISFLLSDKKYANLLENTIHKDFDIQNVRNIFLSLSRIYNASLRDQNQIFSQLILITRMYVPRSLKHIIPICFFLFLKNKDANILESYRNKTFSTNEFIKYLHTKDTRTFLMYSYEGNWLEAYLLYFEKTDYEQKVDLSKYDKIIQGTPGYTKERDSADQIKRNYQQLLQQNWNGFQILENIFERIDMLKNFRLI